MICRQTGSALEPPFGRPVYEKLVKTDTQTVARLLREYAHRSSLRGGNPYRAKAYLKAADSLSALAQPLDRIIAAGMLTDIPGIGDAIADIVTELYQTGSHPSLEKLRQEVPEGLLELFALPGLRPDKILKLHEALGISSLAELEAAAKEDRIRRVKGLGASLQTKILQNLSIARSDETQLHLHKAAALLNHAVASVKSEHPEFTRIEIAGDFRRGCELVSDRHSWLKPKARHLGRKAPAVWMSSSPTRSILGQVFCARPGQRCTWRCSRNSLAAKASISKPMGLSW